eukprot:s693_g27.t1
MKRPAALKRPAAAEEAKDVLGLLYSCHKPDLTQQDFRNHVRTVLRGFLPGKPFEVSFSDNSHVKDDFYNDRLQCLSCKDCEWRGVAKYRPGNGTLEIKGLPMERTGALFAKLDSTSIALCGDGVYKLVREDAGFLSVGILVSDAIKGGTATGHRVSYVELCFGLFGSEKKAEGGSNYVKLLECLFQAVSTLCNGFDLKSRVVALHGDFAEGLESARKLVFGEDVTRRGNRAERAKAHEVDAVTEEEKTWRSGIFKVVSKELVEAQRLDLIEEFVYGTRCLTAIPFSVLWKALLDHLYDVKEQAAADALRRHYLQEDDEGRYTALQKLMTTRADSVGQEHYVAMRRSLFYFNKDGVQEVRHGSRSLCPKVMEQLVVLATTRSEGEAAGALLALGAPFPLHKDPGSVLRVFSKYALVQLGPEASALWRQGAFRSPPPALHTAGVCLWCAPFQVAGACEHYYSALHWRGVVNFDALIAQPPRRRRRRKSGPEPVIRAAPCVVEPDAPDRPVENDVITEREIARSIRSYGVASKESSRDKLVCETVLKLARRERKKVEAVLWLPQLLLMDAELEWHALVKAQSAMRDAWSRYVRSAANPEAICECYYVRRLLRRETPEMKDADKAELVWAMLDAACVSEDPRLAVEVGSQISQVNADVMPSLDARASGCALPEPHWSPGICAVEEQPERAEQDWDHVNAELMPSVDARASGCALPEPHWSPGVCAVEEQPERAEQDWDHVNADVMPSVDARASGCALPEPHWSPGICAVEEQPERAEQDWDHAAPDEVAQDGSCSDVVAHSETSENLSDLCGDESPPHAAIKRARLAPDPALQDKLFGCDDGLAVDVPRVSQEILAADPVVADLSEAVHGWIEYAECKAEADEVQMPVLEEAARGGSAAVVPRQSRGALAGRQFKFGSCPIHACARSAHVFSADASRERRGRAFVCLVSRTFFFSFARQGLLIMHRICNLWWKYESGGRRKCWHMEQATTQQFSVFPKMLKEKYQDLRISLARGAGA